MQDDKQYFVQAQNGQIVRTINRHTWLAWAKRYGLTANVIASAKIGEVQVLTYFYGVCTREGSPKPYMTLVSGGELDGLRQYYLTKEEAKSGHAEVIKRIQTEKSRSERG